MLIWWDEGARLSKRSAEAIRAADQVYVSAASAWEIAIKASLGRITYHRTVTDAIIESGFEELPVRVAHAEGVRDLPPHHRDPFDRILIAQARAEGLTVVTRNRIFGAYEIRTLAV